MWSFEWNAKVQVNKSCLVYIQNSSLGPRHPKADLQLVCEQCVQDLSDQSYPKHGHLTTALIHVIFFMEKSTAPIQVVIKCAAGGIQVWK